MLSVIQAVQLPDGWSLHAAQQPPWPLALIGESGSSCAKLELPYGTTWVMVVHESCGGGWSGVLPQCPYEMLALVQRASKHAKKPKKADEDPAVFLPRHGDNPVLW